MPRRYETFDLNKIRDRHAHGAALDALRLGPATAGPHLDAYWAKTQACGGAGGTAPDWAEAARHGALAVAKADAAGDAFYGCAARWELACAVLFGGERGCGPTFRHGTVRQQCSCPTQLYHQLVIRYTCHGVPPHLAPNNLNALGEPART